MNATLEAVGTLHGTIAIGGGAEPKLQSKIITSIGLGNQHYTPDQGYDGLERLTVTASFREMHYPQNIQVDIGEIWLFAPDGFAPASYNKIRFQDSGGIDQQVYTAGDGGYDFNLYQNGTSTTIPEMFFRDQTGMQSFTASSEWQPITVGSQAFDGCTGLKRVEIKALLSIRVDAFHDCINVADYYFGPGTSVGTSIPSLSHSTDIVGKSGYKIHVPASLETAWKAATNWSELASHIVGDYEV